MSVVINGVTLKNATCNGEKVKKIIYNDNLIYSAEEEYFNGGQSVPWSSYRLYTGSSVTYGTTIIMKGQDNVTHITAYTSNKIDLTNISKVHFTFDSVGLQNNGALRIFIGTNVKLNPFNPSGQVAIASVSSAGTYTLDTSSITGSFYIGIAMASSTGWAGSATISKVIGE